MTGFGRAEGMVGGRRFTVELRSLNSKQLDLLVKLPGVCRDRDPELRQWLSERLVRGKVDLFINSAPGAGQVQARFDPELLKAYYKELQAIGRSLDPDLRTDLFGHVLRMPEVHREIEEPLTDDQWKEVLELVEVAVEAFHAFRANEGARLGQELRDRGAAILSNLEQVGAQDALRTERVRDRLRSKVQELRVEIDMDRFEQELVYYLEKFDITEEKVRLAGHCAHFQETLEGPAQQGRKLGFIAQEMGREMNTIGAKANDADLQRLVVAMKDDLEKIKEQVLNVL
ncbi:MAG: YicC family protein [Flavobacteriales bacterium]|nr:YicC family protein [Flavobacteriales bacterium]MCB9193937.1 YicC family protein [Flavobacteriales bacterium]